VRLVDLVDALIIVLLALLTYAGFRRGFVLSLYDITVGYLSLVLAFTGYSQLGVLLGNWFSLPPATAKVLGFLAIMVVLDLARLVCGAIFTDMHVRIFPGRSANDLIEAAGGLVVGGVRATY